MGTIFYEIWATTAAMSPWLLLGFVIAGLMEQLVPASWIERHLGGRGLGATLKATGIGIPLPVCSCGVIPIAASLHQRGAGPSAVMAFLVATPQTSIDSIVVCAVLISPLFAVFSPLSALLAAVLAAALTTALVSTRHSQAPEPSCPHCCSEAGEPGPAQPSFMRRLWRTSGRDIPRRIGREMAIGIVIAGTVSALVPAPTLASWAGPGLLPKLLVLVAAVPVYVCSSSSVAITAALIAAGVAPGTALVFLLAGPASNAATVLAVRRMLGNRGLAIYLLSVATVAVLMGLGLDLLDPPDITTADNHLHDMLTVWHQVAAIPVLVLFVDAFLARRAGPDKTVCHEADEAP